MDVVVLIEGKDLRPQHARIRDAQQLPLSLVGAGAGDDEEPGAVGGSVQMRGLDGAVEGLLLQREDGKIPLRGRRQRLQRHLQRIAVDPVPEVEQLHGDLGVGQE